jgi:Tol biopolymer transport system component
MDIFSMKPNGSDVQPLAHSGSVNELMGDYSPDGKHIVYQRSYGSGADAIYRMNSDGTKRKVFISNSGNDLIFPRYSANAKYLLYNKEVNPVEIWRARASDGKQKKALLQTAVDNFLFIQA